MKSKTALSAALIYVIIRSIFTFLSRLALFAYGTDYMPPITVLKMSFIWFLMAGFLVVILLLLSKKQHLSLSAAFHDTTARKSVGLIISLDILLALPDTITLIIASIQGLLGIKNNASFPESETLLRESIITSCISVFLSVCLLILGLYLFAHKQKDIDLHEKQPSEAVPRIVLLFFLVTFIASLLSSIVNSISFRPPYLMLTGFLNKSKWWLLLTVATIIILYLRVKKHGNGFVNLLKDDNVKLTAAFLIIIDGLLGLSLDLPTKISQYGSLLQAYKESGFPLYQLEEAFLHYTFALIIPVLQVILGIYFFKRRSGTVDDSEPDNDIPEES